MLAPTITRRLIAELHSYEGFRSALDKGASCAELFDQRRRFTGAEDLAKIDADLARIGCMTRESVRNDR